MKKYAALLILAVLLFGCAGGGAPPQQPPAQTPGNNQTPANQTPVPQNQTPTPKPSLFPMKLTYTMKQEMPGGTIKSYEIVYWLEGEKKCDSRDAVAGIFTMKEVGMTGMQPYAKITVYLDNGEFVNSNYQSEGDLAFDTAKAQRVDMDFMLLMNYMFRNAGRNFLNDSVWNSTEPIILRNVALFGSSANISISKVGNSTSGVVPCTEFSIATKEVSGYSGQLTVCVAKITDSNPLPYVVYVKPKEGEQGPNWELKSVEKVKSGLTVYSQCMSPVSCPSINPPTQEEQNTCMSRNGSIETMKDDKNCVIEYRCMTLKERAEMQLRNNMAPNCQVQQQMVDSLAACWEQQKNADFDRNDRGCITAVRCP